MLGSCKIAGFIASQLSLFLYLLCSHLVFAATSDLMTEEHVQMKRNCSIQKFEDGGGLPPLAALQDLLNWDLTISDSCGLRD